MGWVKILQVVVREKGCWEEDVCVGLGAFRGSPAWGRGFFF
jgi:hypothetical protein